MAPEAFGATRASPAGMPDDEKNDEGDFTSRFAGVKIDWPRTIGYYGAIAAAVGFEVIAPPLGVFIAVVPLLKFLKRPNAAAVERFVAAVFEGAGKPVGGDADGVVRPAWIDDAKAKKEDSKRQLASHPLPSSAETN